MADKMNWKLLVLASLLAVTSIFQNFITITTSGRLFYKLHLYYDFLIQMGYTNAYPNTAITTFKDFLNESAAPPFTMGEGEFQWVWSGIMGVYFIGFALGSGMASSIADKYGRKCSLFAGTIGSLISAFTALFSVIFKCPSSYSVSRLVMSFSAAVSMNSMIILFQESAPEHMKGVISFNAEMAFVVTNLIGGLFGMQGILGQNLVGLVAASIVPSAIACFLAAFLKESPKYLYLRRHDPLQAERSLEFYQNVKDRDGKLVIMDAMKREREKFIEDKRIYAYNLFGDDDTKRGFQLGLATMQLTISIWPLIFFSTEFLTDAGFSYSVAENVSNTMLFVSTLSTLFGMFIVERFSRRWLLIVTAIVNVTALFGFSVCAIAAKQWEFVKYGCIAGLIIHGISYSVAMGPIAWFITSELVPFDCRASAQSLVLASNHILALFLNFLTFPFYKSFGPIILVILYVIPGLFCILMLIFYLPETKNKHINEILEQLKNGINSNGNENKSPKEEDV